MNNQYFQDNDIIDERGEFEVEIAFVPNTLPLYSHGTLEGYRNTRQEFPPGPPPNYTPQKNQQMPGPGFGTIGGPGGPGQGGPGFGFPGGPGGPGQGGPGFGFPGGPGGPVQGGPGPSVPGPGGPTVFAIDPGQINFCLFKFTYIWQTNGMSYWAYLVRAGRNSIAGFRWRRGRWVYFGLDLRNIDSFYCR